MAPSRRRFLLFSTIAAAVIVTITHVSLRHLLPQEQQQQQSSIRALCSGSSSSNNKVEVVVVRSCRNGTSATTTNRTEGTSANNTLLNHDSSKMTSTTTAAARMTGNGSTTSEELLQLKSDLKMSKIENERLKREIIRLRQGNSAGVVARSTSGAKQRQPPVVLMEGKVSTGTNNAGTTTSTPQLEEEDEEWSCRPPRVTSSSNSNSNSNSNSSQATTLKGHTPIMIFAKRRTGSNLLMSMLDRMYQTTDSRHHLSLMTYSELFNSVKPIFTNLGWKALQKHVTSACQSSDVKRGRGGRISLRTSAMRKAHTIYHQRMNNPGAMIRYLSRLPTSAKKAFFAFKIFDWHLEGVQQTVESMVQIVDQNSHTDAAKYIVLWRRRVIETFVSEKVAEESGKWTRFDTSKIQITVNRTELETFVRAEHDYYTLVRRAMEASDNWLVLEYDRDLKDPAVQEQTISKLATFLGIDNIVNVRVIQHKLGLTKQATVPLSQQVINWQEVVEWGYGGEVEEWEDLFASTPNDSDNNNTTPHLQQHQQQRQ